MLMRFSERFRVMAPGICESLGHYRLLFDPAPANIVQKSVALAHGLLIKISISSLAGVYGTSEMLGIIGLVTQFKHRMDKNAAPM